MSRRSIAFRAVLVVSLASFLAGTTGLPLPRLHAPGKDRSQPFPCQDGVCGCFTAEACWRSCCCFSDGEKLLWALENGVKPPEYVVGAATLETAEVSVASCHPAKRSSSCCERRAWESRPSDCSDHKDCPSDTASATNEISVEWVMSIDVRKCRGQAELWLALGAVVPAPTVVALDLHFPRCGDVVEIAAVTTGLSPLPAVPPPRA
jgi:hypothetical protein